MDIRAWIDDHILLKVPRIKRNWEAKTEAAQVELLTEPTEIWNLNKAAEQFTKLYDLPVIVDAVWNVDTATHTATWSGKKYRDPITSLGFPNPSPQERREERLKDARVRKVNRDWIVKQAPDVCLFL